MQNNLSESTKVIIPLYEYEELKRESVILNKLKDGVGILENSYWGRSKYYSTKEFNAKLLKIANEHIKVAKDLKEEQNRLFKLSIFGFWKLKRGYS